MEGGGSKAGTTYVETDDFACNFLKDPVHVHDLHPTMLHLLEHRTDVPYHRRAARPPSVRIALHDFWSRRVVAELIDQIQIGHCSFASGR